MKRPDYSAALKILAAVAAATVINALALTIRTAVFGPGGEMVPVFCLIITMLSGYLAGRLFLSRIPLFAIRASTWKPLKFVSFMLHLRDAAYLASVFVAWILIFFPILAALLVFIRLGIFRTLFEIITVMIGYVAALRYSQRNFSQIMTDRAAISGFIILALCLEMQNFFNKMAYLKPWLLAFSYFFILAYLLIKNQEDIDSNIFDKKHIEKSILPKNLRRLNTFWACVVFLAVILLFNLKPLVIFLLQLLGKVLVYIITAYLWLFNLIKTPVTSTNQDGSTGGIGFFGAGAERIHPYENLILNVFRNAVILYMVYRFLLLCIKWAPVLALKVAGLIKKLFSLKKGENAIETADYCDETETVRPMHEIDQRRHLQKKLKKSIRTLNSISDPVKKVRYMYAFIMTMLPMLGIHAEQSDTTADILKKTAVAIDVSNELSPLTGIYNQVRYGGKIPDDEALMKAEGHFDKAVEVIGQK